MKKGFTLIELLAVILILGIIALIAIPTVNNILKEARRGAFSSTISNIEKAIENDCTLNKIKNNDINYIYTITDGIIYPNIDIKGNLPDGEININDNCEISFLLSDGNFTANKEFTNDIEITDEGTNILYKEGILNGANPVLNDLLVPVTIDKDGIVKKADIYSKWYSYEEKIWANAVILTDTGKIEDDGTILEESIESYFVWIPRFKYKLFDMGNYEGVIEEKPETVSKNPIEIIFENKNTEISNGDEVGEYLSHPAFQAFDVNGFWVGKFETSGAINNLQIKPNKISLKNLNVKIIFETCYTYQRINDSHMMKNTEWGAISYLSLSNYGIKTAINVNNNSSFMTGYSATSNANQTVYPGVIGINESITLPYNTETGYKASTTGNISGIYDMSGGSHEYLAAFVDANLGESGFTTDPTMTYGEKYFDKYSTSSSFEKFNQRILGDGTGEFGPFYYYPDSDGVKKYRNNWFGDEANFVNPTYSWFHRGGYYGSGVLAGQTAFLRHTGKPHIDFGFRVVLAIP